MPRKGDWQRVRAHTKEPWRGKPAHDQSSAPLDFAGVALEDLRTVLGSLGFPELIFIFVLALLVFGPKRLPELGRTVGRALAEFRKATTELKRTINTELIDHELREADPRRIVREQLRETKAGLERALSGTPEAELQGTTGAPTLVLPSGAVSRINSSADDSPPSTRDNDAPGVVEPLIETPPIATSAAVERPAAN